MPYAPPVRITGELQHAAWADKVLPPVEVVRPGLWSIPVPIPDNPMRYVLVYVMELDDGVALVDAGWDTPDAWQALTSGLASLGGSIGDVRGVAVTHLHPDHYGLAGRVREASGAWIGLHRADAELLRDRYEEPDDLVVAMADLLEVCGVPADLVPNLTQSSMQVRAFVRMAAPDRFVEDGEVLDLPGWDLRAVWTPGHSPGHLCFHSPSRRIVLSGDHVLPRITPNIAVHTQQPHNPLADFLDSLGKVEHLECDEVLPGHEWRFAGLDERVTELRDHHRRRLDEVTSVLSELGEATCWAVTTRLTWSRPLDTNSPFLQRAASGETLAHLVLLESLGRVTRTPGRPAIFALAPASVSDDGTAGAIQ
jgi:glyoxylase-like metal-dependent hydrolase (beta-lactamase superfamily II)